MARDVFGGGRMNTALLLKSELKERYGWTDAAIKKFLGAPDESKRNWLYPNGPKLALYARQRVLEAEAIPEWQEWLQGYEKRRERTQRGQQTLRHNKQLEAIEHNKAVLAKLDDELSFLDPNEYKDWIDAAEQLRQEIREAEELEAEGVSV